MSKSLTSLFFFSCLQPWASIQMDKYSHSFAINIVLNKGSKIICDKDVGNPTATCSSLCKSTIMNIQVLPF